MTSEAPGLPEIYRLVTKRGDLHIDDVVVGDETLDANGRWVAVTAIHRRESDRVTHWVVPRKTINQAPEFAPEFRCATGQRWVHAQYRDRGPRRFSIERHDPERPLPKIDPERKAKKLQFIPNSGNWIARGTAEIIAETPREMDAAVVAMMETATKDCTFHWKNRTFSIWEPPTNDGIAHDLLRLIRPEIVTGREESYMTWDGKKYLVAIDPRRMATLPGSDMLEWVRSLSVPEVKAFFHTYWYLNGETRFETMDYPYRAKVAVRNYEMNRLRAVQFAAFRSGSLGRPVKTKGKPEEVKIGLVEGRIGAHKYDVKGFTDEPTWTVTTESGTLSVWGPVNRRESAYLVTGHERS